MISNLSLLLLLIVCGRNATKTSEHSLRKYWLIGGGTLVAYFIFYLFLAFNPKIFISDVWKKYQCFRPDDSKYDFRQNYLFEKALKPEIEIICPSPIRTKMSINKYGLRRTQNEPADIHKTRIGVFGDNYLLGLGIDDYSTLAHFLSEKHPAQVMNFAVSGTSPLTFLNTIKLIEQNKILPELETIILNVRATHFARDAQKGKWSFAKRRNPNRYDPMDYAFHDGPKKVYVFYQNLMRYLESTRVEKKQIYLSATYLNEVWGICRKRFCSKMIIVFWPTNNQYEAEALAYFKSKINPDILKIDVPANLNFLDDEHHLNRSGQKLVADLIRASGNL